MHWFHCAVYLACGFLQVSDPPPRPVDSAAQLEPAMHLYRQAHQHSIDGDDVELREVLDQLVSQHASTAVAEVAVLRLAECFLSDNEALQALELLERWHPRLSASRSLPELMPGDELKHYRLQLTAIRSLDDDHLQLEKLRSLHEQLVPMARESDATAGLTPAATKLRQSAQGLASEVASLAATVAEDANRFDEAGRWLEVQLDGCDSPQKAELQRRIDRDLPLSEARHALLAGNFDRCITLANHVLHQSDGREEVAPRFLLLECAMQSRRSAEALKQCAELEDLALELQDGNSGSPPDWLFAIAVRQIEIALLQRRGSEALQLCQRALQQWTNDSQRLELQYLLARAAIAEVEFSTAEAALQSIVDSADGAGQETGIKSQWLLGELYFLRKDFSAAIDAYSAAAESAARNLDYAQWQRRSLLQLAKCQELTGQPAEAMKNYRAVGRIGHDATTAEAQTRMAALEALTETKR